MTGLQRLAALAPTLKEAEFRVLLYLAARAEATGETAVAASSREIAEEAKVARSSVVTALDSLTSRALIATRQGTAKKPAAYQLATFSRPGLSGGPAAGPPQPLSGPNPGPPLDLFPDHRGPTTGPPPTETKGLARPDRRVESEGVLLLEAILDRRARAQIKHFDPEIVATCRRWMHGYMLKFPDQQLRMEMDRGMGAPHPPDDKLVAQFLAMGDGVGGWDRLQRLLHDLMVERKPIYKYGWFLTVAMQRLHGITAQVVQQHTRKMKLVGAATPPPPKVPRHEPEQLPLTDDQRQQTSEWADALARTAALKKMG